MNSPGDEDVSQELRRLAEAQLSDLESDEPERFERGRERRVRVMTLYKANVIEDAEDFYFAALIMLYGDEAKHHDLARQLAQRAADDGEQRAWSVVAAAWDRSLLARGMPQRFGTQFVRENGRLSLGSIDPRITDAQRAMYGVLPLWVQRQHLEQLQRREENEG